MFSSPLLGASIIHQWIQGAQAQAYHIQFLLPAINPCFLHHAVSYVLQPVIVVDSPAVSPFARFGAMAHIVDTALDKRAAEGNPVRVGLVGAGFMAKGLVLQIEKVEIAM